MKIFAAVLFVSALPLMAQQPDFKVDKNTRSIAITATASVVNMADVATVHVGFLAYGPDKDAAYANGSKVSNAIMEALRANGVKKDAIESVSQEVEATQNFSEKMSSSDRAARAFHVQQSWTVRVAAEDGAKVLDIAVKAGANDSGAIDWSLRDANAAQEAAAAKALQRARSQAASMAGGLNVKLGGLLYASNQVEEIPVRSLFSFAKLSPGVMAPPPPPLAISARQIDTSATVYAVFAIE